jgi:hypothetical protein
VDHALGDALAVEVLHLLEKLHILHQHRAARAGGQGVLAGDRRAVGGGQSRIGSVGLAHDSLLGSGVGSSCAPPWQGRGVSALSAPERMRASHEDVSFSHIAAPCVSR